jgi:L-threonylcarbamoyladenylate synthase
MTFVTPRFDTSDDDTREEGLAAAATAIRKGELVVMPTDTVYGIGCDAFDPAAVARLLKAKRRGRDMPPPVLVSTVTTLDALATGIPDWARTLVEEFWPGPLTLVCTQQSSLQWDLGDARGTVAIRMPDDDVALELLQRTGPLAVSSANLSGRPAALDADQAIEMLGTEVTAVLDSGPAPGELASTILDCTGAKPRVLREGALPLDRIREVLALTGLSFEGEEPAVVPGIVVHDFADEAPVKRAARKTTAKKAPAKKTPAKKTAVKTAAVKKTAVKKAAVKKAAVKTTAKKAAPRKTATKAPAKKSTGEGSATGA